MNHNTVPVYTVDLPEYSFDNCEPDHQSIGKPVDDELRKHFMGKTVLIRGLSSQEHPGKSINELIEIIKIS